MVFNATFNTISVISWRSVLLVDKTGEPGENDRPVFIDCIKDNLQIVFNVGLKNNIKLYMLKTA